VQDAGIAVDVVVGAGVAAAAVVVAGDNCDSADSSAVMDSIDAVVAVVAAEVEVAVAVVIPEVLVVGTGTTLADGLDHNHVEVAVTITARHPMEIPKC